MKAISHTPVFRRINSRVWEWLIRSHGEVIAGGYCSTLREARNDAAIWIRLHP